MNLSISPAAKAGWRVGQPTKNARAPGLAVCGAGGNAKGAGWEEKRPGSDANWPDWKAGWLDLDTGWLDWTTSWTGWDTCLADWNTCCAGWKESWPDLEAKLAGCGFPSARVMAQALHEVFQSLREVVQRGHDAAQLLPQITELIPGSSQREHWAAKSAPVSFVALHLFTPAASFPARP